MPGVFDNNGNVGNVLFSHNGDPKTCTVWAIDQALTPIGCSEEFVSFKIDQLLLLVSFL